MDTQGKEGFSVLADLFNPKDSQPSNWNCKHWQFPCFPKIHTSSFLLQKDKFLFLVQILSYYYVP